jgi:hypothetical protein
MLGRKTTWRMFLYKHNALGLTDKRIQNAERIAVLVYENTSKIEGHASVRKSRWRIIARVYPRLFGA